MKHLSWAALRGWMPIVVGSAVLVWVCVATILITLHVASIDQGIIAQQQADHRTLANHIALLHRLEQDEARYCQAAKDSGNQTIIKVVCP